MEIATIPAPPKGRMSRKLDENSTTRRLQIPAPDSLIAKVDAWRRDQPDLPSRADAFRRLVEIGLAAKS